MVRARTSALSVWKSHVQRAPRPTRKVWTLGRAGGSGADGSEVT